MAGADLPTGTNPFNLAYPLLSTRKRGFGRSIGLVMAQELGGFSFFQSIHYEKTQPIMLDSSIPFGGGSHFNGRTMLRRKDALNISFFTGLTVLSVCIMIYDYGSSGLMEFNHQPLTYGQNPTWPNDSNRYAFLFPGGTCCEGG